MADFNQTRSDYLKIMMGGEGNPSSPYRPEQMNDLGGTSFDAASLSDADIDSAIKMLSQAGQNGSAVFSALSAEKEKREEGQEGKSWWDNVVDFLVNTGTSVTEGIFKAVDEVKDFAIGVGAGLFGGGWFGAKNDFTDWAADVIKDDSWIDYATRAVDMVQANILRKEFWTNEGGYWTDWSYENTKRLQDKHYEGLGWERTAGNFVGEMLPNLLLTYFTAGSNLGVQAAAQGGLSFARSYGGAQSQALNEGASFQQSAGYGAVKGTISGGITAAMMGIGGSAFGKEGGIGGKVGDFFGNIAKKAGTGAEIFATKAGQALTYAGFGAVNGFTQAMADPVFKQITYDSDAIAEAYGDNERVQKTLTRAGFAALSQAAMSLAASALREGGTRLHQGKERYRANFYTQKALRVQSRLESELKSLNNDLKAGKEVNINARMDKIQQLTSEIENYGKNVADYWGERYVEYQRGDQSQSRALVDPNKETSTSFEMSAELKSFENLIKRHIFTNTIMRNIKDLDQDVHASYNPDGSGEVFVGKAGITYPAKSEIAFYSDVENPDLPEVEARIVNGKTVLVPSNAEQMLTIASLASDPQARQTLPEEIVLPFKVDKASVLLKDLTEVEQVRKLATLTNSDLKKQEDGSMAANLGKGKSLVISPDFKTAKIVPENETLASVKSKGDNDLYETGFRELQKTSRAELSSKSWKERSHSFDEGLRGRLSRTFEQELINRGYGNRPDNGVLTVSAKGNTFEIYKDVDAETFHDVFEIARTYLENGELVDLHGIKTTEDGVGYEDTTNYLSKDGMSGFSITKEGDLISVFNLNSKKGFLRAIAPFVKENVKTLDCYISPKQNLQEMYSKIFGFKTASVMDWNPEYDHDDIGRNHSTPKVAFMVNVNHAVETKQFGKDDYGAAKDYQTESTKPAPFSTKAEASVVKEAANAKIGEVYSLSSAKDMAKAVENAIASILQDAKVTVTPEEKPSQPEASETPKPKYLDTLLREEFLSRILERGGSINELPPLYLGQLDSWLEGNTGLAIQINASYAHGEGYEPEIVRARAGKPLSRYDSGLADYDGDFAVTSKILAGIAFDKSDIANYDDPESGAYFDYKAMQDKIAPVLTECLEDMTTALDEADSTSPLSEEDFARAYSAYRYLQSEVWQDFMGSAEDAYNEKFGSMDEWYDDVNTSADYFADSFEHYVDNILTEYKEAANAPAQVEAQATEKPIEAVKLTNYGKGQMTKMVFDNINLGNDEQKQAAKDAFRKRLLETKVRYEVKGEEGEEPKSYTYKLSELLNELKADDESNLSDRFDAEFDKAWGEMLQSGADSRLTRVVTAFADKLKELTAYAKDLKESVKTFGHIEKHRGNILRRYYHDNGETFGPSFDFDTQGFKVLLEPLNQLKPNNGKRSYTGKSAITAFSQFLTNYQADNFTEKIVVNGDNEISITKGIYNQGLRDLASALVESIQDNSYIDKNGKPIYKSLDSRQLRMLRLFQDEVERMPRRAETDAVESTSTAKAAYQGVERYLSSVTKDSGGIGTVRKFLQWYMEVYGNNLDAIRYEAGDNELSKTVYGPLYVESAKARGMEDDYRTKIEGIRKVHNVTNKKLNSLSDFTDTYGKKVEMRYLVRVYHHLLSGEESNNVKYIEANTVYLVNPSRKLVHVCKFSYADRVRIHNALSHANLLEYAKELHDIESKDLRKVYDEDYLRDCHLPNSNSISDYTRTVLASNKSQLGKAYVKSGTANYGTRKDRVKNIPTGVHLVITDAEQSIMESVRNQANIHFIDPVLKKINSILGSKLNSEGKTVKELFVQKNPKAIELIERAIWGAYGINPNKQGKLIDFVGNGYVMSLIGLNPSTILRQPLSIMWSNDISMSTVLRFTLGANLNPTVWKNSTRLKKEIEEEFPELRLRGKQNEAIMGNVAADTVGKIQRAISKVAGYGIKKADAWTVGHEAIGLLSLQGQKLGYGNVGTRENDDYVKTHYQAFYATQVSSNRITMSGARAGYYSGLGRFTSFMTGAIQGQIGHIARGIQQTIEFKGKTQQYYDDLINKTKAAEAEAKDDYEEAKRRLDETIKDFEEGNAERDDVKQAKDDLKDSFDRYTEASGAKSDAENSAKAFRHFRDMGGTKGVVIGRVAGALVTGLMLVAINELASRLKGQKRWDEFDAGSAGTDLAVNTLGGWLPVVRDVVNAVKGYDLEIPEYAVLRQFYDLATAVGQAAKDPSEKNGRSLIRQAIESISAFLGIPATNLWKYANGIIKTFSPSTAIEMNNLLYGASSTSMAKYAKEYAEKADISTAADLYQSLYAISKTGEISREAAVEQAKLVADGFNPIARSVPDYIQGEEGERVILSEDQRTDFSKAYSEANKQVEKLIKSARYKNYQPETKAKEIKKVYDIYYEAARYKALGIDPDSKLGKVLAYASDYGDDVVALLLLIQQNSEFADKFNSTRKEQAIKLVNKQPMGKAQRLLALYLMGYGVSEENKESVRKYLISIGFTREQADDFLPSK